MCPKANIVLRDYLSITMPYNMATTDATINRVVEFTDLTKLGVLLLGQKAGIHFIVPQKADTAFTINTQLLVV